MAGMVVEFIGASVVIARMPGQKKPFRMEFGISPSSKRLGFRGLYKPGESSTSTGTSFDLLIGRYEWDGEALRVSLQSAYTIPEDVSDRGQVLWVLKRQSDK